MVKSCFSNIVVAQYAQRIGPRSPCRYQNLRMLESLKRVWSNENRWPSEFGPAKPTDMEGQLLSAPFLNHNVR